MITAAKEGSMTADREEIDTEREREEDVLKALKEGKASHCWPFDKSPRTPAFCLFYCFYKSILAAKTCSGVQKSQQTIDLLKRSEEREPTAKVRRLPTTTKVPLSSNQPIPTNLSSNMINIKRTVHLVAASVLAVKVFYNEIMVAINSVDTAITQSPQPCKSITLSFLPSLTLPFS